MKRKILLMLFLSLSVAMTFCGAILALNPCGDPIDTPGYPPCSCGDPIDTPGYPPCSCGDPVDVSSYPT